MTRPIFEQPPKRCRAFAMICGSLVFHTALVGTAALWIQPGKVVPPDRPLITVEMGDPLDDHVDDQPAPPALMAEPVPQAIPEIAVPDVEPEPAPDQEIVDPVLPKPPLPKVSAPRLPQKTATANMAARSSSLASASNVGGASHSLVGGISGGAGLKGWRFTTPVYPYEERKRHVEGIACVRVATDAVGRVSEVTILKSSGSGALDANTLSRVRAEWSGPANSTVVREVQYRLQ